MEDIFEELAAVGSDDEGRIEEGDQGGSGNRDDEAEEANDTRRVVKPKRVITRPRPKLDPARLLGPRGIFVVKSTFEGIKFRGKGHELDDLNNVLSRLQHWAHRLFPKMTFEDCIERIEELGNKKEIHTNMHKIRNGMIDLDNAQSNDNDEADVDRVSTPPPIDNAFDLLVAAAPSTPQPTLTDEQRARMMRNRLLAEERRMARRLAREKELEEQRRVANSSAGDADQGGSTGVLTVEDGSKEAPSSAVTSGNVSFGDNMPSCVLGDSSTLPTSSTNLHLQVAGSNSMDVDSLRESNSAVPAVTEQRRDVQTSSAANVTATPHCTLTDDAMDVGSAEDWEAASAVEEHAIARNQ